MGKKRLLRWIPIVIWAIVIFLFSSQNASLSSDNNRFVISLLKHIGINLDMLLGSSNSNFIVRKAAHFTEYLILYFLLYRALYGDKNMNKTLILSLLFTFLYASSDEFHQSFVPGRGPSFRDVFIDTSSGIFCMIIIIIKYKLKTKKTLQS